MIKENRSVLFVDICDSTKLMDTLGDEDGRGLLTRCLALLGRTIEAGGGTVLDEIGDELLASFPTVLAAAQTACALQVAVADAVDCGSLPSGFNVRIGFHHGSVILQDSGIFGMTVHLARRVASASKAQQIVTSRETLELLPLSAGVASRFLDRAHVKGRDEPLEMVEILWDPALGTMHSEGPLCTSTHGEDRQLVLWCGEQTATVEVARPVVTLGRGAHCDLVVDHGKVSRLHGRFEFRKGAFYFVDASTNGSFAALRELQPVFLRRDEVRLDGEGSVSLGGEDPDVPKVRFSVRERPCSDNS